MVVQAASIIGIAIAKSYHDKTEEGGCEPVLVADVISTGNRYQPVLLRAATSTGQPSDQYWLLFALREGGWTKGWRRGGAKEHRGAGRRQVVGGALWGGLQGKMGGKGTLTKIFSEISHRCG